VLFRLSKTRTLPSTFSASAGGAEDDNDVELTPGKTAEKDKGRKIVFLGVAFSLRSHDFEKKISIVF
jgi:hypothetical protein